MAVSTLSGTCINEHCARPTCSISTSTRAGTKIGETEELGELEVRKTNQLDRYGRAHPPRKRNRSSGRFNHVSYLKCFTAVDRRSRSRPSILCHWGMESWSLAAHDAMTARLTAPTEMGAVVSPTGATTAGTAGDDEMFPFGVRG